MNPLSVLEEPSVLVVLTDARVTVTATFPAYHTCPFVDEADEGTITLVWSTGPATLELHAVARWLDSLDEWFVSHEDYTERILVGLRALGVDVISARSTWSTAGGAIEVLAQ